MSSKNKIIISAEKLFLLKGYKNTSINDILEESEVSKGSFFHHFKDKKSLFINVIDFFYEKEMVTLFKKHFKGKENPRKQIINFCNEINDLYKKYNYIGGCLIGNLSLELSDIDEIFREKLNEIINKWKKELVIVLSMINTKKTPEEISDYIIWGLEGLTLTAKVHKNQEKNKSEFNTFIEILEVLMQEKS